MNKVQLGAAVGVTLGLAALGWRLGQSKPRPPLPPSLPGFQTPTHSPSRPQPVKARPVTPSQARRDSDTPQRTATSYQPAPHTQSSAAGKSAPAPQAQTQASCDSALRSASASLRAVAMPGGVSWAIPAELPGTAQPIVDGARGLIGFSVSGALFDLWGKPAQARQALLSAYPPTLRRLPKPKTQAPSRLSFSTQRSQPQRRQAPDAFVCLWPNGDRTDAVVARAADGQALAAWKGMPAELVDQAAEALGWNNALR